MDELLLAIDAGTGSCRAVLFDLAGNQVAISQREYRHELEPGVPGSQRFDTAENWRLICACVRDVVGHDGRADAVKAVSATSMREGMVIYSRSGEEIWACPNVDSRATSEAEELVRAGHANEIYAVAGDWVSITAPARFRWIAKNRPDVLDAAHRIGMLGDWILNKLCGAYVTDPSLGSSSGMFDLERRDWSERVLEIVGIDRGLFPEVVEPGTVIGEVTPDAATATGLAAGTPVVVGGADTQLGLVGIGVTEPGRCTTVGGTFWQHTAVLDEAIIDPQGRLRTLCHTVPGRWMVEGIGFYCGLAMRWFRDAFCELEQEQAIREGVDVYHLLEERAAAVPAGANGVFGIFSNLMQTNHWTHASPAFVGFDIADPARAGKAECVRSLEESAAYVTRGHHEFIRELTGWPLDEIVFTGGAAKGRLWPQILADVLGVTVQIPEVKESTALGAALYAGAGIGAYASAVEAAHELVRFERSFEPDASEHQRYRELFESWLEIYARSLELADAGLVRPLWRAAGT